MKEKLIALGLTEEQVSQVLEQFKGYVPPERFNEINEAKKVAESAVAERDKQLNELKKGVGDNEELKKQIETLQAENKATKEKYESDIQTMRINNAIDQALTGAGAKNLKAVRALLDLEKIKMDGEAVTGIEDQIKALTSAEDSKFLFNVKTETKQSPVGMKAGEGGKSTDKPYSQMTYSERVAFLEAGGKAE